jgi:hypothetical protein
LVNAGGTLTATSEKGAPQRYDPVPLFGLISLVRIRAADAGTAPGSAGNTEKTNPCEAVKPEIAGICRATEGLD